MAIRNPLEWGAGHLGLVARDGDALPSEIRPRILTPPVLRRIGADDLRAALQAGLSDFCAWRTDVIVLCVVYPVIGLLLARLALDENILPLLFPLVAGFALLGPLFAVGLNEMSRRRELGQSVNWADAFGVMRAPAFMSIVGLGLLLLAIFLAWLVVATVIYRVTLGPHGPVSIMAFAHDVLTTRAGWAMIVLGCGVGSLFAVMVLAIGAISFPLLLDRGSLVDVAIATSVRATVANPATMAGWGLIVAFGLVLGSLPLFLGLPIVLPVLGHASWHLYRRLVPA